MGKQNKSKKLHKRIRELQSVHSESDPKKIAMVFMKQTGGFGKGRKNGEEITGKGKECRERIKPAS